MADFYNLSPKKLFNQIVQTISPYWGEREAAAITNLLMDKILNINIKDRILDEEITCSEANKSRLTKAIDRLKKNEPIQYILEEAAFYGRIFRVNPSVLIPRPETEELVHLIVRENKKTRPVLLDIGTGSGCIAITLQKELPGATVYALDVDEKALNTASENAQRHNAPIKFMHCDIIEENIAYPEIDILVSNPPYIHENEKKSIQKHVLDFEPHLALFTNNSDPLFFYRHITALAVKQLNAKGKLYFEVNARYAKDVHSLLTESGFKEVKTITDMQGKERIVSGVVGGDAV